MDGLFASVLRMYGFDSGVVVTLGGWTMPPSPRGVARCLRGGAR
jgi:hypothetical protein